MDMTDWDAIDAVLIDEWDPRQPFLEVAYSPRMGELSLAVRDATGVELNHEELWMRLLRLRDRREIWCEDDDGT